MRRYGDGKEVNGGRWGVEESKAMFLDEVDGNIYRVQKKKGLVRTIET
jgi:hypothetical protein